MFDEDNTSDMNSQLCMKISKNRMMRHIFCDTIFKHRTVLPACPKEQSRNSKIRPR